MIDDIFVWHHERTGASLFLSERGTTERPESSADDRGPKGDNEHIRKARGVPCVLRGEEPEA